jgi:hypothetical protein
MTRGAAVAITTACACGKEIRVKDELAGKKVRCPSCQAVLIVPQLDEEEDEPPPAKKRAKRDEDETPRRPTREEALAAKPRRRPSKAEEEEEEEEEEDERPQRAKRGKKGPEKQKGGAPLALWLGLGGGGLLVVALVVVVIVVLSRPNKEKAPLVKGPDVLKPLPKKPDTPIDKPGKPDEKEIVPPASGVTKIILEDLGRELNFNREAVWKKYANATVELTGPVHKFGPVRSLGVEGENRGYLTIPYEAGDNPNALAVITREKEPWALVGRGQVVTVRGKLKEGLFRGTWLHDAEFVGLKGNTSVTIKAADYAAELAKDREGTIAKYKNKSLILVGEVLRRNESKFYVYLKGTDRMTIDCQMTTGGGELLNEGTEVRIYCPAPDRALGNENGFILEWCLPILGKK